MIRPAQPIIDTVHCSDLKGYRREWRAFEGLDYFPTDEPFVDLFALDIDCDGGAQLVCPCGEAVYPGATLGEIADQARELAAKHGKA